MHGAKTISIVSGFFNPLHRGHLRMMWAAREQAQALAVIVNNDDQQLAKKGRIIMPEGDRLAIVRALRMVTDAFIAVDQDASVSSSLRRLRARCPRDRLVFCNGGDRNTDAEIREAETCRELGIALRFGVGGDIKTDSSTRVLAAMEAS